MHEDEAKRRELLYSLRTWPFFAFVALVGGVVALVAAIVIGAPLGEEHSCPAGSQLVSCHYPADAAMWNLSWFIGGAVVGLLVATYVAVAFGRDRRPRP